MRKKVLVLSGSPRKNGNSDMLCDAFVKGAEKAGHLTEKIFIQNKKIFPMFGLLWVQKYTFMCSKR